MVCDPAVATKKGAAVPEYPLSQMTTSELARYRRDLEGSLRGLPAHAPVRADLKARLDLVEAEEESRARLAERNGAP